MSRENDFDAIRNWLGEALQDPEQARPHGLNAWLQHNEIISRPRIQPVRNYPPMIECVIWDATRERGITLEGSAVTWEW